MRIKIKMSASETGRTETVDLEELGFTEEQWKGNSGIITQKGKCYLESSNLTFFHCLNCIKGWHETIFLPL